MQLLVVEDNEVMAEALQRGLLAEGYGVDVANNGNDGIWRIREFSYAAVILDIMLPGMNGYEICRTIRSEGIDTPVLMLTAKDGDYDIAEGLDFGANDYLTKPFSFVVLTARIRALVRRQTGGSNLITIGNLVLDTVAHSCHLDEQIIELTHREYFLLEAFARHVGQPLTRGQLLNQVWGADHDADSNVVDVYVGYLRKKLHSVNDHKVKPTNGSEIETVRGIGYRLVQT